MISDKCAIQLLHKLLEPVNISQSDGDKSSRINQEDWIVPTSLSAIQSGYLTFQRLVQELQDMLQTFDGRLSLVDASQLLSVDLEYIEAAAEELCTRSCNNGSTLRIIQKELITSAYMEQFTLHDIEPLVEMNGGKLTMSDLASHLQIPSAELVEAIQQCAHQISFKIRTNTREVVTTAYEQRIKSEVKGAFLAVTVPTQIDAVLANFTHWDLEETLGCLRELCGSVLPGELRLPAAARTGPAHSTNDEASLAIRSHNAGSGAIYIPWVHTVLQRQTVDRLFKADGYITKAKLESLAVSTAKMTEFVKQSFPNVIAMPNSIIDPDVILSLVGSVTSESDQLRSFVDLRLHLPEEIVLNKEDMKAILEKVSTQSTSESQSTSSEEEVRDIGEIVVYGSDIYYFSSGMVQDILKNILTPLAQSYGEARASQILKELGDIKTNPRTSEKGGARSRRQAKKKQSRLPDTLDQGELGIFPLPCLASQIVNTYPELGSVDYQRVKVTGNISSQANNWNDSNEVMGIVAEFCRVCFYSDAMRLCAENVGKQLKEMMASRNEGIANMADPAFMRSIEINFEKNFAPLCYNVQMFRKLAESFDRSSELRKALERDFLISVGADFARKLTEYCLIKYADCVDHMKFTFEVDDKRLSGQPADLPGFCYPPDPAVLRFSKVFINCTRDTGELIDPLKALRDELPPSVGVSLARLWMYCGGECYNGGEVVLEDEVYVRSGNFEKFLTHIEEYCLQICGLPFKVLDKKPEKHALFVRRRELCSALENAVQGENIFELTVALLFQQAKNLAVAGHDVGILFEALLFAAGNVLPRCVVATLVDVKNRLQNGVVCDDALISRVRSIGLCRDISKYEEGQEDIDGTP